ncbi:MAG: hypothetical protein NTW16_05220 [Bacteroidetes bacterium]|nr:hypothetical protein [Bacteroidota bacterium]
MRSIKNVAQYCLLIVFSVTILFHMFVLLKVIPYSIVWGGRLQSDAAMYRFEFVSLGIAVLFLMVILVKFQILKWRVPILAGNLALWSMLALFMINIVANLMSDSFLEKIIFTPIAILLSVLILIVILKK